MRGHQELLYTVRTFFMLSLVVDAKGENKEFWVVNGLNDKLLLLTPQVFDQYEQKLKEAMRPRLEALANQIFALPKSNIGNKVYVECLIIADTAVEDDRLSFQIRLSEKSKLELKDDMYLKNERSPIDFDILEKKSLHAIHICHQIFIKMLRHKNKIRTILPELQSTYRKEVVDNPLELRSASAIGMVVSFCIYLIERKIIKARLEDLKDFFLGKPIDESVVFDWIYRKKTHLAMLFQRLRVGEYVIQMPYRSGKRVVPQNFISRHFTIDGQAIRKEYNQKVNYTKLEDDLERALKFLEFKK